MSGWSYDLLIAGLVILLGVSVLVGISIGAPFGAVAVILLGSGVPLGAGVSLAAFLGAGATAIAVMAIGRRAGRFSPTRLVLAGVAIGALCSSGPSSLRINARPLLRRWFRVEPILASSIVTGAVVAVVGGIGFVGLLASHVARMLVRPEHRKTLLTAGLLGVSSRVLLDLLAGTLERSVELPLGIFAGAVGTPVFVWLMRRDNRLAGAG